jgi:hypothetical protein
MAIGVTLPIIAPSGLESVLVSGGQLDVDTTYYYVVMAFDAFDCTPNAQIAAQRCFHSPISEEGSFTTSGSELSALITWTNVTGATNYQILVSETSGDYTASKMYGTVAENVGTITDGSTGYTVTALGTDTYAHHSCQIVNQLPGQFNKDLGLIKVALSGTEAHDLQDLYDAIDSAGFSDYVYWDGGQFTLKGSITVDGSDAGTLTVLGKKVSFVRGVLSNLNPNYIITFGAWGSDETGATYSQGCTVEFGNARYPLWGASTNNVRFYGTLVKGLGKASNLTENSNIGYYHGGSAMTIRGYVEEYRDAFMGLVGRGTFGDVKDLKWNESNNWSGGAKIRLLSTSHTSSHGWATGKFYNCKFTTTDWLTNGYYDYSAQYNIRFYDCTFSYTDNLIPLNKLRYTSTTQAWEFGAQGEWFFWFYNTFKVTVIDETGVALSGVEIAAVDVDGNPATWVENDDTFDRKITGTEYTTNRFTDSSGQIDYYLESYKMNLDPDYSGTSPSIASIRYAKYPYNITFTKLGYISNSFKINMWRAEDTVVTLKSSYLSNKIVTNKVVKLKVTP